MNLHWTTYFTNIKGIVQQNMHHYNDVIEWVVHCEKWVGEWAQGSKKKPLEYIPCHMDSHLWCGKIFHDEAWNILPHRQRFNMKTPIVLSNVVYICSNDACDL